MHVVLCSGRISSFRINVVQSYHEKPVVIDEETKKNEEGYEKVYHGSRKAHRMMTKSEKKGYGKIMTLVRNENIFDKNSIRRPGSRPLGPPRSSGASRSCQKWRQSAMNCKGPGLWI